MTPADDDDKSTKSTKSSSSKGKSDIGKMFGEMNKTIKTFGKAMSQVSEELNTSQTTQALELSLMLKSVVLDCVIVAMLLQYDLCRYGTSSY